MQDRELEQKTKKKTLLYTLAAGMVFLLAASWYATQNVAELCNYAPVLGFNIAHIYFPWQYFVWANHPQIAPLIPQILEAQEKWFYIAVWGCFPVGFLIRKSLIVNISHGSASWASMKDIDDSGLGQYEEDGKTVKNSGVVVGINPYTDTLMLHNGKEHILLMAPTRSGKGVNTIIPTGLIWRHSIFFFDVKNELWNFTSRYRRDAFGQKVMKFEPLCADGSSVRWNPLAEVDFQTSREINDVSTIVEIMVRPDGKKGGGEDFWPDSAAKLLKGIIIHLLYAHYQEGKPLPCPTDVMSFLSSPDKTLTELFEYMKMYPHISSEEFMSGNNVIHEIYGEYIKDWRSFNKTIKQWHMQPVHNIEDAREAIRKHLETIKSNPKKENDVKWSDPPFCYLLTHPKVAECAADMLKGAEQTTASIMQTAQTAMALYQNPVVQQNTAVSDFMMRDLLNPAQTVSLYLCIAPNDVQTIKPLSRLFINTMLSKLIRDMKFDDSGKQRLLLMLDEFPQLGNMQSIELALAVCAGYGIKMCIVSQDVNQLNKEYTKDNSISSNCHVHIYFTPNLDNGGATAEAISKSLGKKTISTVSHSDGGGLFKGSDSTSFTARELMTPDEVSRLSPKKEIVFVAGHKPILGKKLFYFEHDWLDKRTKLKPPLYSDTLTVIASYEDLFKVHAAERKDLEERTAEVREGKAYLQLDSAKDEKLRADTAIKEARENLSALRKEKSDAPNVRRDFGAAESRLAMAENAANLAEARVQVYEIYYQLVTLENLLTKAQAEKRNVSASSEAFFSVESDLKEAQHNYDEAKGKLSGALAKEARVQQTVDADNRQIRARLNLMAAIEKLNSTRESMEPIIREKEEKRKNQNSESPDSMETSPRERDAKRSLEIAAAAKESAEREYNEAKAAYKALMEAFQRQDAAADRQKNDKGEKGTPKEDLREELPDKENRGGNTEEASDSEEEFNEDWEGELFGDDPVDEEMDDADMDGYVEEEGEEKDGEDDESAPGGSQAKRGGDESSAANKDNGAKTSFDGAWRAGQEQEEIGDIPEEPEAAAAALSARMIKKQEARDEKREKWAIRHRPSDSHRNRGQRGGE